MIKLHFHAFSFPYFSFFLETVYYNCILPMLLAIFSCIFDNHFTAKLIVELHRTQESTWKLLFIMKKSMKFKFDLNPFQH